MGCAGARRRCPGSVSAPPPPTGSCPTASSSKPSEAIKDKQDIEAKNIEVEAKATANLDLAMKERQEVEAKNL